MTSFPRITQRPLTVLAALNALLAVVLGFVAIPAERALELIRHYGYWAVLLVFVLFVWSVVRVFRRAEWGAWRPREAADWGGFASIAGGWWMLLAHESFGFRIIMDEIMLLGTSMGMHLDKLVQTPVRGHDIQGAFVIVQGIVDKRPAFFPFLLSLLHDFTGYRPENAFALNAVLALLLCVLVYGLGRRIAGRLAGSVGVLLLAGLPLLGQNATGGGFELLNLAMIFACLWLGIRWLDTLEAPELSAFCLAVTLLAQTRYESALFVLPAAALIALGWWRAREVRLSPVAAFTPLLLLPVPLLQKIFQMREASWEMFSKPGSESPFGLDYVFENLAHAWAFFFSTDGGQPNSLLLSTLGLLGLAFFLLHLVRLLPRLGAASSVEASATLWGVGLLGLYALLMCYFWGKFDDPVIARLSLPVHGLYVLILWLVVPAFPRAPRVWQALLGLCFVQLWGWSIPAMANHAYTLNYVHGLEVAWRRAFVASHPERDYLVIDPSSIVWITHKVSATTMEQARARKEAIQFHRRNKTFGAIYVFQHFDIDPDTGRMSMKPDYQLGPDYVLETVVERRLHPYSLSRISRVVDILDGPSAASGAAAAKGETGNAAPASAAPGPVGSAALVATATPEAPASPYAALPPNATAEEKRRAKEAKEKLKKEYWDNWLRNLP